MPLGKLRSFRVHSPVLPRGEAAMRGFRTCLWRTRTEAGWYGPECTLDPHCPSMARAPCRVGALGSPLGLLRVEGLETKGQSSAMLAASLGEGRHPHCQPWESQRNPQNHGPPPPPTWSQEQDNRRQPSSAIGRIWVRQEGLLKMIFHFCRSQ